ncbi:thioredoxin family protein [Marinicrinis sediminis]|uniref:Thioredoxin family protein n=1 Tax=Marinicrinis sediminis TaxID=1652465 RepID=A0ABW5R7D4_9BACL
MEKLATREQFEQVIAAGKPAIVVFKTTWCRDCHYIDPFMPDLEKAYADKLDFYHVDRDELPDLCEAYNILGIPSFIGFKNGQELIRFVSKLRKSREEIEQFLDRVVAVAEAV